MDYLQKVNPDLLIPYLEHIIYVWKESSTLFHNSLVHKYRELVRVMLAEYKNALPEAQEPAPAGAEPGELGLLRRKLLKFLEASDSYNTETLPTYLFNDGLFDERAIVMGKIGNHKEALVIYVYNLNDMKKAEDYCKKTYDARKSPGSKDVSTRVNFTLVSCNVLCYIQTFFN